MKTIHKYIFLAMSMILASSTVVSQQNFQNNLSGTNDESHEVVYTEANTGYAVDMDGNHIYKTTDKGLSWVNVRVPGKDQIKEIFLSIPKDKSDSKAGFEGDVKTGSKVSMTGSDGFMPADDYDNEQNSTSIRFTLLNPGFVSIKIYDNTGKSIDEIAKSSFGAGDHEVKWNRSKFSNGSFYYSIITSEFSKTEKIK